MKKIYYFVFLLTIMLAIGGCLKTKEEDNDRYSKTNTAKIIKLLASQSQSTNSSIQLSSSKYSASASTTESVIQEGIFVTGTTVNNFYPLAYFKTITAEQIDSLAAEISANRNSSYIVLYNKALNFYDYQGLNHFLENSVNASTKISTTIKVINKITGKPQYPAGQSAAVVITSASFTLLNSIGVLGLDEYKVNIVVSDNTVYKLKAEGVADIYPKEFLVTNLAAASDLVRISSSIEKFYLVPFDANGELCGDRYEVILKTAPPAPMSTKLPIGMNLSGLNYFTTSLVFTDVMTTASEMITTFLTDKWDSPWNSEKIDEIVRDENGYPTYLPQKTSDDRMTIVRFLVNNYYSGKYRILYDGEGTLAAGAVKENDKYYINFDGSGSHKWIDITSSTLGNPLRNIRILPMEYENASAYPIFLEKYLEGLRPFHTLRFMDWINTNNSGQIHWNKRVTDTYYTQGGKNGISFDYGVKLANELNANAWVCVPHKASDDYIRQMAKFWKENLKPELKIYLEYSNEIWNWQFGQSHYVLENAPGAVDSYVSQSLAAINPAAVGHPEKDAYMMSRVFKIWSEEFSGADAGRLVKVATGQHAWVDNSRRILEYLFNTANVKCDALSVGGYFSYSKEDHDFWIAHPELATPDRICDDVANRFSTTTDVWTRSSAAYAKQFGVDYLVYEGGQHMQPYQQNEWSYNGNLYQAQITEKMYQLYQKNFALHTEADVNCKLFMAFSYIGPRESKYGSWGHLENLSQIGSSYRSTAPKYQALLDFNTSK